MPGVDGVQIISLVGALLILGAFAANQLGVLRTSQVTYNLVNLCGALILAWVAVISAQYGFIVLEGAWAVISLVALLRRASKPREHRPSNQEGSSAR